MNFRSILFVLGLTTVFFFVNQYFAPKPRPETQVLSQEGSSASVRAANLNSLPAFRLYHDLQGKEVATLGMQTAQDSFLVVSKKELPKQLFVQKGRAFIPVHLITDGDGALSFYSAAHEPKIVTTAVPELGEQSLQLVTLSDGFLKVFGAEYENGKVSFPEETPESNALVFYSLENRYFPVGLYESKKKKVRFLSEWENFTAYTSFQTDRSLNIDEREETLYVLQNPYMQVVFSTLGGSIAEVNLPFKKQSPESVVLPIQFDRIIDKKYPSNSLFPRKSYYVSDGSGQTVKQPVQGGYYPLLRRGISKGAGYPPYAVPPEYYAFNVVSDDPDTAQVRYRMTHMDANSISFSATFQNRRITKTYSFPNGEEVAPYCLFATIKVDGDARGLWVTSGVPEVELISGSPAPIIKYSAVQNNKLTVEKLSLPKPSTTLSSVEPDWIANSNGYFALIMDPLSPIAPGVQANAVPGQADPSRIVMIDSKYDLYPPNKYPGYQVHLPLQKTNQPIDFRLFLGPQEHTVLKKVDAAFTNQVTGYNPHYIDTQSFHGWFSFISEPFAKFLFLIMNFFYKITRSWGFSIILLTVVLRVMMYPLNAWSIKSNLKMQDLQPKVQKIQEKYKKDPKRVQIEMMQLYKQHKANPFGGCLPMIIQMPFLIGMFDLLKSTFSLRGAIFIPGWINNLTAPDVLFSWSYPIPFVGTQFHLLPILLGVVMFFQSKFMAPQTAGPLTDQQKQQKKMGSMMTIVFTVLFYKFPSGLNLYWLSSMLLQILQQFLTSKRNKKKKSPTNPNEIVINSKNKR